MTLQHFPLVNKTPDCSKSTRRTRKTIHTFRTQSGTAHCRDFQINHDSHRRDYTVSTLALTSNLVHANDCQHTMQNSHSYLSEECGGVTPVPQPLPVPLVANMPGKMEESGPANVVDPTSIMPPILVDDIGGEGKLSPMRPSPLPLRVLSSFTYRPSTPGAPPFVNALSTDEGPLVGPRNVAHRFKCEPVQGNGGGEIIASFCQRCVRTHSRHAQ